MSRVTKFPIEGRPDHAVSDRYPYVVNSKDGKHMCVECPDPCDFFSFYYGNPNCAERFGEAGAVLSTSSQRPCSMRQVIADKADPNWDCRTACEDYDRCVADGGNPFVLNDEQG